MSWTQVYAMQWPRLAHGYGWTPSQIQALTLDEFSEAIEYLKGVTGGGG